MPVHQRILGFDKRTLWPGLVALVVWAAFAVVFPAIEGAIKLLASDVQKRVNIANVDGVRGVLAPFVGAEQDGFVATYVFERADQPSIGVSVTVIADPEAHEELATDVASMLTSITYRPTAEEGGNS